MGKLSLAEKLDLPSTNKGHVIDAAEKRIAELEAENASLRRIVSLRTAIERCGDCGGLKATGCVCLDCQE